MPDCVVMGLEYSAGMEDSARATRRLPGSPGVKGDGNIPNEAVPKLQTDSARVEVSSG